MLKNKTTPILEDSRGLGHISKALSRTVTVIIIIYDNMKKTTIYIHTYVSTYEARELQNFVREAKHRNC